MWGLFKMSEAVLKLKEEDFVGKGCHKYTYLYPCDKKKCIKVIYNSEGHIDIKRELSYRRYRDEHGLQTDLIPAYYGTVETDKGPGYVFEYICDFDGKVSLTLMDYIENEELFAKELEEIIPLMRKLKHKLFEDKIISMGITPENIVIQKTSPEEKEIYLITDLGVSEAIPLVLLFDSLAMKKITRKYNKMIKDFLERWPSEPMRKLVEALE